MRVAIVAESFLPNMNGVTNSVLRVLDYLAEHGHEALVIAPGARAFQEEIESYRGFEIVRVPTVMVPLIDSLPIGVPHGRVATSIREFHPDVVHLASPFVLGAAGAFTARALRVPSIAIYQTDVAGFANNYRLSLMSTFAWYWTKAIHNSCSRTLAPSSPTIADLESHGIKRIHHWGRGVDLERFQPMNRNEELRRQWSPEGHPIVGYVGRLAAEKNVHRLEQLDARDDIQLVIVGDGPSRADLEHRMPNAVFTGQLGGDKLAEAYASLDCFVHPGEWETFCQTIQEAHASGVPTIGPNAGGPRDLIHPGIDGELLEVDSFADTVCDAVDRWTGAASSNALRATCRAAVANRSWEALGDELMSHYAEVADVESRFREDSQVH
ncbi:glycosyltransferase family 1 protein [Corynebacterium sp. TAE3-ERU12]|uniref:glycosyltransferase family 4 protein n=1 Tax=Corynebacterium sp. TAE3-ERU12 TaxID=2849491 RepID=UPI001C45143B|nr:glycosyltransferase family 1 protein [Corynebacterium sp. TAE3-ERU12]MBV7294570.1 glycosyltransferase family 1 protein [Corynebacterium sp. TAE3-ERU12]